MFTARQFHGKPVINIVDGKRLGEIVDLYLDQSLDKVKAIFLGSEGFITRRSYVVDLASIQVCGADVWLVAGADKVVSLDSYAGADSIVLASTVKGREIQTEGGVKVAVVDDIILDAEANVIGFTLSRVHVQGRLAERKQIARSAISNPGAKDQPMIALLEQAETAAIPETY